MKAAGKRYVGPAAVAAGWLLLALWTGGELRAGAIDPDLQLRLATAAPGEEIPVIVDFAGQVDLTQFRVMRNAERGRLREGLVRALRSQADFSQRGVISLLKKRGKLSPDDDMADQPPGRSGAAGGYL